MSQRKRILNHLMLYGSITNAQANNKYGIRHLPAVIRDIKKMGHKIKDDRWEEGKNRFGERCRWKVYELQD